MASTQYFRIRNFVKYQHYKNRRPPWVKLYRDLWQDPSFFSLSDHNKLSTIGLLTIASETDNKIPLDGKWIRSRLSISKAPDFNALFASGFIEPIEDNASTLLATCTTNIEDRSIVETEVQIYRDTEEQSNNSRSDSKSESSEPAVISLPLVDKSDHHLTAADLAELSKLYPGVDPEQELLKAKGWLIANPVRRKTPRGIARFIHGWLSRAQDRSRNSAGANGKSYVPDTIGESPPAAGPMDPEYEKLVNEKADALFGGLEI
jgi:hypothetical protein